MSNQELQELIETLARTPEAIANLVHDLSNDDLRWRNENGEFSAIENVCHLRDIEVEGYTVRLNRIINQENPFLADIDGGRLAIENRAGRNLTRCLATPIGPTPGPPPPWGIQKVLCKFKWQTSAP